MSGKRKYGAMSTAQLLKKARKYTKQRASAQPSLQRAVNAAVRKTVEKKGVDTPLDFTTIVSTTNSNGSAACLNLIQAGTGSFNRVGRKVHLQSLRVRGELLWTLAPQSTTSNYTGNTVRMVVVWDRQPSDSAIPTFDTVFGVTGQDSSETSSFLNPVKYDNMDRFSVLRDCVVTFEPPIYNAAAGTQNRVQVRKTFDEFIKLNGKETVYSATTNPLQVTAIASGSLLIYFRAAENTSPANEVQVSAATSFTRLRYIDP